MHSLFSSEENISKVEYKEIKNNLTTVAHNGRDKNFTLAKHGKNIPLKSELSKILKELESIAIMMKGMKNDDVYMQSIEDQKQKIEKNEKLPSNLVLDKMIKNGYSFYEFCMENIWKQQKYFSNLRANNHILKLLIRESELSNIKKKELEKKENEKYEDYVKNYFLDI
jgi:gamma-glutamylcysteine synthetase